MSRILADFRLSLRTLARARGFSLAVVTTLALAIALQTAVIAFVNAYLVRGLPYPESERLYNVAYAAPNGPMVEGLENVNWSALDDVVQHRIAWDLDVFYLVGSGYTEAARGAWVTPGFMHGLGISPLLGRGFTPEEYQPGGPQVALISHTLWQTRFRSDSVILGRTFEAFVSDRPDDPELFTVVGVLPAQFWHMNPYTDVLTPLRGASYPYFVRLHAGVPPVVAAHRITQVARDGGATLAEGREVELQSVHARYTSSVKPMLLAVAAAVTLVLLIACANVAFLVLVRGLRRQKEMAVRLALGGGQVRVARLLVAEALILAGTAAALGVALAWFLTGETASAISQQLGRPAPGGAAAVSIDASVAFAVVGVTMLIAVALTLIPFYGTTRRALYGVLRRGKQGGVEGASGRRMRFSLIVVEVAGSIALLVGCGLMVRTVTRMLDVDMGLRPAGILTTGLAIRERSYPDAASRETFVTRLLGELERTPGVQSVALSTPPPLAEHAPRSVRSDGAAESHPAGLQTVSPGYFATLDIPIVQGRAFTPQDRVASEPVAIVSRSAAARLWPGASPIGRRISVSQSQGMWDDSLVTRTVVGVVGDVRHAPTDDATADVYIPLLQVPGRFTSVVLRAGGSPAAWLPQLREVVARLDPQAALNPVLSLDATLDQQISRPRFLASLFAGFGVFATILALVGLYGVIAYTAKQREHEVAVRMAVGAAPSSIQRLFLKEGMLLLPAGLALGTLGALGMGRLLQAQLYGVAPLDALTTFSAALILALASLLAVWWPARRATRTDPVIALREE
jgi:putative ABC transport system permease protein